MQLVSELNYDKLAKCLTDPLQCTETTNNLTGSIWQSSIILSDTSTASEAEHQSDRTHHTSDKVIVRK